MKKLILISVILLSAHLALAQDTIVSRHRNYYYSQWYDTCACYHYRSYLMVMGLGGPGGAIHQQYYAISNTTPRPLEVIGIAGMISTRRSTNAYVLDNTLDTEYFYLAYYDSVTNTMTYLDSCRWDLEKPRLEYLPMTDDPDSYPGGWIGSPTQPCYIYEAYFDNPVVVDSTFFLISSANSNYSYSVNTVNYCPHKPFYFAVVSSGFPECIPDKPMQITLQTGPGLQYQWEPFDYWPTWGPFLPIVRPQHLVTVHSADSSMGAVRGGTFYPDSSLAHLQAIPNYGYRFSHWSDGDSSATRFLVVTSDTVLTAYFESRPFCSLRVETCDPAQGSVSGGGDYPVGEVVSITAVPAGDSYRFTCWQDGNTANPRAVYLTQDTLFTAYFLPTGSSSITAADAAVPFTLSPNPATGAVTVAVGDAVPLPAKLSVADASGKEMLRRTLRDRFCRLASLPAGIYFVTLSTPQGSSTKKLVISE